MWINTKIYTLAEWTNPEGEVVPQDQRVQQQGDALRLHH
jgi:hypothetical protein